MEVTVFGMGYVGCVTAACFASMGHDVTGVDVSETKVDMVNAGQSPIIEPGLGELVQKQVESGRLRAVTKAKSLGDVVIVCVGTPSNDNGSLNLSQMLRVVADIGELLAVAERHSVIAIRSTVLPGTLDEHVIPLLEKTSGRKCDTDFGICMNPEFMREGTAIADFLNPALTVVGSQVAVVAERMSQLYAELNAPVEQTSLREAEMIKYACNAFHATKICFANEIGSLSKGFGVDSHRVMEILCRDDRLNISPYYLKPGFAFGGSCLPKDLRAILHRARQVDVDVPMLGSLLESNQRTIETAFNMVRKSGKNRIGVLGLSFKAGTDDLRESPIVTLIESLIGKGYKVSIYDEEVSLAAINGANRRYIEQAIPHISSLMKTSIDEVVESSEVILVSKTGRQFGAAVKKGCGDRTVIDLVRLWPHVNGEPAKYEGISW